MIKEIVFDHQRFQPTMGVIIFRCRARLRPCCFVLSDPWSVFRLLILSRCAVVDIDLRLPKHDAVRFTSSASVPRAAGPGRDAADVQAHATSVA
jgi:hypothetical protein